MTKTPESQLNPSLHLILLALMAGDRHGYAIMQAVEGITHGATRLGPATLYTNLKKLLDLGFIAEVAERPDPALDDERRRYYRITAQGRTVADAETRRLEAIVRYARNIEVAL
jgi:DNA-binding PadR family transcriptional regulator